MKNLKLQFTSDDYKSLPLETPSIKPVECQPYKCRICYYRKQMTGICNSVTDAYYVSLYTLLVRQQLNFTVMSINDQIVNNS